MDSMLGKGLKSIEDGLFDARQSAELNKDWKTYNKIDEIIFRVQGLGLVLSLRSKDG
jgi:hypothetical protein